MTLTPYQRRLLLSELVDNTRRRANVLVKPRTTEETRHPIKTTVIQFLIKSVMENDRFELIFFLNTIFHRVFEKYFPIRRLYFSTFIHRETLNAKSKIRKYVVIGFLKRNAFKLVAQHFSNVDRYVQIVRSILSFLL